MQQDLSSLLKWNFRTLLFETRCLVCLSIFILRCGYCLHSLHPSFFRNQVTNCFCSLVQVSNTQSFGALSSVGITGLAGLGPGFSSVIKGKVGSAGDTLLDNIFQVCQFKFDSRVLEFTYPSCS